VKAKILLVEDNDQNRYLATFLLEQAGYGVMHARNGKDALVIAEAQPPDLILMDIQMPEMDGYEAAQLLRMKPKFAKVPLVAVTSYAMPGDQDRAMRIGFAGYIEKPIATDTFVAQIEVFLQSAPPTP
jgi:two-component system cell cycle response regulator DivK